MECLPSDVVLDILSRVPVESVFDCKLVCKSFLKLLGDRWDQFAKMHRQQQLLQLASYGDASSATGLLFSFVVEDDECANRLYYGAKYNDEMNIHEKFSYKTLQKTSVSYPLEVQGQVIIVGSCNGLICLNKYHRGLPDPIHICNPNTGEYVNLPEYTLREEHYLDAFGFGYVHSATNDQYKVVRIYYPYFDDTEGEVQVYTIGSGSGWRTIGRTSDKVFFTYPLGIFVDGALYWTALKQIVAFNLADEEFRVIQPPPCYDSYYCYSSRTLVALRGNLCFCDQRHDKHLLDIWSLKKNTTEASWSKDFSIKYDSAKEIDANSSLIPLLVTKKNEVLFVDEYKDVLYCYDPKLTAVIKLWDVEKSELMSMWITASPHMNTFVSLEALGEKSEKKKVRERSLEDTD